MTAGRRKWLIAAASIVLAPVLIIATLPFWFPWVLPSQAARFGAHYDRYERIGYTRCRLSGLTATNQAGRFSADSVESFVPTAWVWNRWRGQGKVVFLDVRSWAWIAARPGPTSEPTAAPTSAYRTFGDARKVVAPIRDWIPHAVLSDGLIQSGGFQVRIPELTWVAGRLKATALVMERPEPVEVLADAHSKSEWDLSAGSTGLDLRVRMTATDVSDAMAMAGTIEWRTNRLRIEARFPRQGFVPEQASLRSEAFEVPAQWLRLSGYSDLNGSIHGEWVSNRYSIEVTARAVPAQAADLPALDVNLRAMGDKTRAWIQDAGIIGPGLKALLREPVDIQFRSPFLTRPAGWLVEMDLGRQPWFAGSGRITGSFELLPGNTNGPKARFALDGSDLVLASNLVVTSVTADGDWAWPRLNFARGRAELVDGTLVDLSGQVDALDKTVHGELNYSGGGRIIHRYLPSGLTFSKAFITARVDGPFHAISHSARVEIDGLTSPRLRPMRLEANWMGDMAAIRKADVTLTSGSSLLRLHGAAEFSTSTNQLLLNGLDLVRTNRTLLSLRQPCRVEFQRTQGGWILRGQPLDWAGDDRGIFVDAGAQWPATGRFRASVRGVGSELIDDFVQDGGMVATISEASLEGGWSNGPVNFALQSRMDARTPEQLEFVADADIVGGPDGIEVKGLSISSGTQMVCRATGLLPVSVNPASTNGVLLVSGQRPLHFEATTEPESIFWQDMESLSGLVIQKPDLRVRMDGPMGAVTGRVAFRAAALRLSKSDGWLPGAGDVRLDGEIDADKARISRLTARVEGQPVELTAEVPLGNPYWSGAWRKRQLPDWRAAKAHLLLTNTSLASLKAYLPKILNPEGYAKADITLAPGGMLGGEISVRNLRTRTLDIVGPVRDIKATVMLSGRSAVLTNFSVDIGGAPVKGEGKLDQIESLWRSNGLPKFRVRLHGSDVPLARTSGLVLRADVDLQVTNAVSRPPLIFGTINLRQSLFMSDLQNLVAGKTASPKTRPPYFSIEVQPWAAWLLNVRVTGDQFMQFRTPFFTGKISATMTLGGTLKAPVALGDIKINTGVVSFPFGTLDVKQGLISLTSEHPYDPELYVVATAMRLGYEVRMEATGRADAPVLQFSSSPPLGSEQIVAMLTTGQVPMGSAATSSTWSRAGGVAVFLGNGLLSDLGYGKTGESPFSLRSGEQVSETGRETYEATYRVTEELSLVGEYDRFDQYNLNLKWRVFSR